MIGLAANENKTEKIEVNRKIIRNSKDLSFIEAVYTAFPDAERDEDFGITACGEDLLIRRFKKGF